MPSKYEGQYVTRSNIFFPADISLISFMENNSAFLSESRFCQSNSFLFFTLTSFCLTSIIAKFQRKINYDIPHFSLGT
jgi:hypothetical protein